MVQTDRRKPAASLRRARLIPLRPPWRRALPSAGLGRPGPRLPRLARLHHDRRRAAPAAGPAPVAARSARPAAATHRDRRSARV